MATLNELRAEYRDLVDEASEATSEHLAHRVPVELIALHAIARILVQQLELVEAIVQDTRRERLIAELEHLVQ